LIASNLKISAVSYLNTKPFLYGLSNSDLYNELTISLDIPSVCASKLINAEVDLGLVPVATIPLVKNAEIISDYCIAAVGAVKTVCIYSEKPLEQLKFIYLDYQSRSSVLLTKILFEKYFNLNPVFLNAGIDYIQNIKSETGGLVIGDRAIGMVNRFPFVYDLSEAWYNMTGLPFVFAVWVANKHLGDEFNARFNTALRNGISQAESVAGNYQSLYPDFNVLDYYTRYLSFTMDENKKKGLALFLNLSQKFM
jgi:chorismate dehydratase